MQPSELERLERTLFTYRFRHVRTIDGDTVEGVLDLGCHVRLHTRLRLLGINAPELRGVTNLQGIRSRDHLNYLIGKYGQARFDGQHLLVQTALDKRDKYGRLLADLYGADGGDLVNFNERMIIDGHAQVATY